MRNLALIKNFKGADPAKLREVLQGKEDVEVVVRVKDGVQMEHMIDKRVNAKRQRAVLEARKRNRVSDMLADVNLEKRTAVGAVDYQTTTQHLVKVKCEIREKKLMTS